MSMKMHDEIHDFANCDGYLANLTGPRITGHALRDCLD